MESMANGQTIKGMKSSWMGSRFLRAARALLALSRECFVQRMFGVLCAPRGLQSC